MGALFHYADRYREGLNQLLLYSFELHSWSESVIFPGHNAGNRQYRNRDKLRGDQWRRVGPTALKCADQDQKLTGKAVEARNADA